MKISTKGRYALRVIMDLALNGGEEGYISLGDISTRQGISLKYLEIIMSSLKSSGLVASARGKSGGYRLIKPINQYNAGEILKSAEGSLSTVHCLVSQDVTCPKADSCLTLPLWAGLNEAIDNYLEGYTIDKLLGNCEGVK